MAIPLVLLKRLRIQFFIGVDLKSLILKRIVQTFENIIVTNFFLFRSNIYFQTTAC